MADFDEDEDTSILGQIHTSVKLEGFNPGTAEFDKRKRQLQVAKCREMRGLTSCQECPANDVCQIYSQVKRDNAGI